jgi:hypothetical protein
MLLMLRLTTMVEVMGLCPNPPSEIELGDLVQWVLGRVILNRVVSGPQGSDGTLFEPFA